MPPPSLNCRAGARCVAAPSCPNALETCANYSISRLLKNLEPQLSQQVRNYKINASRINPPGILLTATKEAFIL